MKIIDKYLVKQFLTMVLFGLLAISLLFVVIDLMENLDDFIDHNVSNGMIIKYYIVFIPEILRLITPVAVLLASLFTAGKMSNLNELTAMKASGISLYRFMIPFLITSFFISLISIYFGGFVVPDANKEKVFIEQNYMQKGIERTGSNVFFQDSRTRIVSIQYFNTSDNIAHKVSIQEFDAKDITQMISRMDAERMQYDTSAGIWIVRDGVQRFFRNNKETMNPFIEIKIDYLGFKPADVVKKQQKPVEMTLSELNELAADQLKTGNDPTRILIEYHSRYSFAFASLIVVFFGLPISGNKRKGGMAIQVLIILLVTFTYLFLMKIAEAFGKNGVVNPVLTAWSVNFLFLLGAIYNTYKNRK
ncbi:MAG: YjgP/YjgQ family permease [Ignavibacteria bacterium]|nr:YjgP/YjgQ family permease [Ignavibacteria bacterium]